MSLADLEEGDWCVSGNAEEVGPSVECSCMCYVDADMTQISLSVALCVSGWRHEDVLLWGRQWSEVWPRGTRLYIVPSMLMYHTF